MEKKSFVFYISWNEAIKELNELQVRNFINNLCNYSEGKDVVLNDLNEKILWSQVQPLLDHNEGKRQKRIENGRKGGLSKVTNQVNSSPLNSTTQDLVHSSPLNSTTQDLVHSSPLNSTTVDLTPPAVEGRGMKDEGRGMKDEGRRLKDEGRGMKDDGRRLKVEQQEWNNLLEKKNSVGWNKLSTSECSRYYELEEIFNKS